MTDNIRVVSDCSGDSFEYGGIEETIGFITDNYYEMMRIYRTIIQQVKDSNEIRDEAHEHLQELRDSEEEWTRTGRFPKDFDNEEHADLKDYLVRIRESEYDIIYKGKPLKCDKKTYYIIHHMWLFKMLDRLDRKGRKHIGFMASNALRIALWPMKTMMRITSENTRSDKMRSFLKENLTIFDMIPDLVKDKIITV